MNVLRRALIAGVMAALIPAAAIGSTTAGFTADTAAPGNGVGTATLPAPVLRGMDGVGSSQLSWDPAPTGGAQPVYTLTRTSQTSPTPVTIYQGTATSYTDPGNLPAETRTDTYTLLAAGGYHTVAATSDTVWAWGSNNYGQLGDGSTTNRSTAVRVTPLADGQTIESVAVGYYHTVAVASDGTVWAWGRNNYGQLGDGSTTNRSTAVRVTPLADGQTIESVAAGYYHTVAVASDGTAWAWGNNDYGQIGDGTNISRSTPVQVAPLPGGRTFESVAAGFHYTVAVASDGTAWAWGYNGTGQLGDGSTTNRLIPTQVPPLPDGRTFESVAAGFYNTVAVASDGTAWAWGGNDFGQLGNGGTGLSLTPVQVTPLPDGRMIQSVAAGIYHSVALASDGTAWAWGYNGSGQLGDGSTTSHPSPTQVTPLPDGRTIGSIAAGFYSTVAVASDGTAWAWGSNSLGQLGDGTSTNRLSPTQVAPIIVTACPPGSVPLADPSSCSLAAGTTYTYTLTVSIGGWSAGPARLSLTAQ